MLEVEAFLGDRTLLTVGVIALVMVKLWVAVLVVEVSNVVSPAVMAPRKVLWAPWRL